jgi:hypothetical protein
LFVIGCVVLEIRILGTDPGFDPVQYNLLTNK